MRKPLIAGNWKMNGSHDQINTLMDGIKQGLVDTADIDIVVCPTFVHLAQVKQLIQHTPIKLGAQNLYVGTTGAFTGEVAGPMLSEVGCQYVLVGHSERRTLFHEDLHLVAQKFQSAINSGLKPILCVGETRKEREENLTEKIVREQIISVIETVGIAAFSQAVIAYEPVWAIGTGLVATPEQAQAVHCYIRSVIAQNNVDLAKTICILYGGSMKADNAASLLAMPDVDGGLIGGASLDAKSFLTICTLANQQFVMEKTIN